MSSTFHIEPSFRPLFIASGLDSYDALMNAPVGTLVSAPQDRRRLYRLELVDLHGKCRRFYLKRMSGEPVLPMLKSLVSGRLPHCGPVRELQLLQALDRNGFAVMEPVAWGEGHRCGLPVGGFLVVAEVCGRDVATLAVTLPEQDRLALFRNVGELVGRLHVTGFLHPVRFKDLILEEETQRLVLIDRETGKPWPQRFSASRAIEALARTARRTLRDGHRFGPAAMRHFFDGYTAGVSNRWAVDAGELRRAVLTRLRRDLRVQS